MPAVRFCVWDAARQAWDCGGTVFPVTHWPAPATEAQIGAQQRQGPRPTGTPSDRALAGWLRLINPPQLLTMGGPGQPTPEPARD